MCGSAFPPPVLKFVWQRLHTYIFVPWDRAASGTGSERVAEYSACDWRSLLVSPTSAGRGGRAGAGMKFRVAIYLESKSRICRKSTMSSGVVGAGPGGASFFKRLICFTITKMISARMMKLIATVMKLP